MRMNALRMTGIGIPEENIYETERQKIRHAGTHEGLAQRETGDDDHDHGRRERMHCITPGKATKRQHYTDTD